MNLSWLIENKVVFHKRYVAEYNKSKLERKRKLYQKEHETEQGGVEKIEILESTEIQ